MFIPHIKLIHKYPTMCKKMIVDKGALRHVLSGADIMCPGLTSAGGKIDDEAEVGDVVAIYAEGKKHCIAVGILKKSP